MVDFSTSTSFNQSVNSQYNTSYIGLYDALSIPVLYLAYLPMESGLITKPKSVSTNGSCP